MWGERGVRDVVCVCVWARAQACIPQDAGDAGSERAEGVFSTLDVLFTVVRACFCVLVFE